ncbi:MAG TPA: sulfurtransferase FdhD, partial [Acetobacterium sp.]|nr:sulfurtransferase FdhD [Acetobacterium sp.]
AIGQALMEEKNLAEAILFTTGRIPSDMVIKAIRSGIPVIASHSAPTDEAVLLARQFNLTLIGFVRGKRMNLYAGK